MSTAFFMHVYSYRAPIKGQLDILIKIRHKMCKYMLSMKRRYFGFFWKRKRIEKWYRSTFINGYCQKLDLMLQWQVEWIANRWSWTQVLLESHSAERPRWMEIVICASKYSHEYAKAKVIWYFQDRPQPSFWALISIHDESQNIVSCS